MSEEYSVSSECSDAGTTWRLVPMMGAYSNLELAGLGDKMTGRCHWRDKPDGNHRRQLYSRYVSLPTLVLLLRAGVGARSLPSLPSSKQVRNDVSYLRNAVLTGFFAV